MVFLEFNSKGLDNAEELQLVKVTLAKSSPEIVV